MILFVIFIVFSRHFPFCSSIESFIATVFLKTTIIITGAAAYRKTDVISRRRRPVAGEMDKLKDVTWPTTAGALYRLPTSLTLWRPLLPYG